MVWVLYCACTHAETAKGPVRSTVTPKTVLFISSYHPAFPTFFPQIKGIGEVLSPAGVKFDVEFMDAKRFYTAADEEIFYENLQKKLLKLPRYDLILSGDDAALHFVDEHRSTLFPDQPVVFFGVNDIPYALSFDKDPQITGVVEKVSISETVKVIRDTVCQSRPFVAVSDSTESGDATTKQFEQNMKDMGITDYELLSLKQLRFDEVLDKLHSKPPPCAILLLAMYRDYTGATQEFDQSLNSIEQNTSAPIFHLWYHGMGHGALGGKLVSHRRQAATASRIALRILEGNATPELPVVQDSPNEFVFDYRQLSRYGLTLDDVPPNSRIMNKPDSLFYRYRLYFFSLLAFTLILISVVLFLLLRSHRRELTRQQMIARTLELEEKVGQRTEALELARQETERTLQMRDTILDNSLVAIVLMKNRRVGWINQYAEECFGYKRDEIVGNASNFVYLSQEDFEKVDREAPLILRQGLSYQAEFPFVRKDGSIWWGMISGRAIDPRHLGKGILFIIADITARKIAENQLLKLNELLESQATTDHLTSISNRRHITSLINAELVRSNRYEQPFSIILMDVDHFKCINDTYGHDAGDRVLQSIANVLRTTCREVDAVARWGGEEFLMLCPKTDHGEASKLAELLRDRIQKCDFGLPQQVTASFGVACRNAGQSLDALLSEADSALYRAKQTRNRVCG